MTQAEAHVGDLVTAAKGAGKEWTAQKWA